MRMGSRSDSRLCSALCCEMVSASAMNLELHLFASQMMGQPISALRTARMSKYRPRIRLRNIPNPPFYLFDATGRLASRPYRPCPPRKAIERSKTSWENCSVNMCPPRIVCTWAFGSAAVRLSAMAPDTT